MDFKEHFGAENATYDCDGKINRYPTQYRDFAFMRTSFAGNCHQLFAIRDFDYFWDRDKTNQEGNREREYDFQIQGRIAYIISDCF